jgi:cyclopropane-fatty-acyl-phospholipid synthase
MLAGAAKRLPSWFEKLFQDLGISGQIVLPDGSLITTGADAPRFRITVHSEELLRRPHDERSLGEAYLHCELDLEGDMLAILDVRQQLCNRLRAASFLSFLADRLLLPVRRSHKRVIDRHYTFGNDFYFQFLDTQYRLYSHCLFARDDEALELAAGRKLETTWQALDLQPGMSLLDIGAGWGGTFEFFCPRGVKLTGLTLFQNSYDYIRELLERRNFDATVLLQDFLDYEPREPFDAIVTYGVIEHIPEYRRFFERVWQCLKPGGRIYVDGSASTKKYDLSEFTRRYIWQGAHSYMCLQDVVQEALFHGFHVVEVKDESHDYELTMLNWAKRLDRHHETISQLWGEELYRLFRLFLWGGVRAFREDELQAYHVVARRGENPGPRPGLFPRVTAFVKQLI